MRTAACLVVVLVACGGAPKATPSDASQDDGPGGGADALPDGTLDAFVTPLPPTTQDGTLRLELADSITGTLQATDPNGDALTYSIVTQPMAGTISNFNPATGAFTYTSTTLASGTDSFTFQANDGTANAASPGTVSITIDPVLFTGHWAITGVTDNGATCSDGAFRLGHATAAGSTAGYFAVAQRVFSCGSTTWTFVPGRFTISGSSVTDAVMTFSQSQSVSGCGTVTNTFRIARTLTGFTYQETASVPCFGVGTHVIAGTATRTQSAYLFAEPEAVAFGKVYLNDPAPVQKVKLRNVGRIGATAVVATAPAAPYAFEGGTFPGTTGTCGAQLGGLASCDVAISMSTTPLGAANSGAWSTAYMDGVDAESENGTIAGEVIPKFVNPIAVAAGYNYQCVLDTGAVTCWGTNAATPSAVPTLANPTKITAGDSHACALDATGVHCWGTNTNGQATVPALTSPTAVTAGTAHTCALDATGVHCWGRNTSGETSVPALTNPTAVSAGGAHTCALDATGVHCWGSNTSGQTTVPALTNPTQVSTGYSHTCALDATGVHCWGSTTFGVSTVPSLTNPTVVSAGGINTCAIANGTAQCWGFWGAPWSASVANATAISAGYNHMCALTGASVTCRAGSIVEYP